MSTRRSILVVAIFVAAILVGAAASAAGQEPGAQEIGIPAPPAAGSEGADYFEARVRPLLVAHCQKCHGAQKQENGLRLDRREAFFHGGDDGPAVVPGDADKSLLIQALRQTGDIKMPPRTKLSAEKIATFTQWVKIGAPWPADDATAAASASSPDLVKQHWAFQPVREPALPAVKDKNWEQTPLDRFILLKLETAGLSPSPAADRRTLIRRATFDLLGLPPTPEQTAAFVADASPDAYPRLVDRLLDSPQYGQRWARYWLDVARYADTKGYVFQEDRNYPFAYTYRDWVVRSLNADMPYDQFLRQQIAADLLPRSDDSSLAALGFLTLGRRFLNVRPDIIDDRLDVIFRGTQALTVTCARCHDHKFDPIPTDDYYSLFGVLDCSVDKTVPLSPPSPAYVEVLRQRQDALADFVARQREAAGNLLRAKVRPYLLAASRTLGDPQPAPTAGEKLQDKLVPILVIHWRDYLEAQRKQSPQVWEPLFLAAGAAQQFSAWRQVRLLDSGDVAQEGAERADAGAVNPLLLKSLRQSKPANLEELVNCYADVLAAVDHQWKQARLTAAVQYTLPPKKLADADAEALRQVLYADNSPTNVSQNDLNELLGKEDKAELKRRGEAVDQWTTSPAAPPQSLVLNDAELNKKPHVFLRGNVNTPGKEVPRQFLALLTAGERRPFQEGSGWLEMARQIAAPENPLTARVMVNRVWMYHFGAPLVATPSDFGMRSEAPTQGELLDYLAARFVAEGWSLKTLHRLIMLSATYQQASMLRTEAQAVDPDNRLVWRMNRRRLDWEAMRDALLAVSGQLDLKLDGPAVDIFAQPFSPRRSLYGFIDRQNLPGVLRTFDFATPDTHSPRRFTTTVPPQALYLMNHPFVVQAAKRLANRPDVNSLPPGQQRVQRMFEMMFDRLPAEEELKVAEDFVQAASDRQSQTSGADNTANARHAGDPYGKHADQLDAWERLAQALLMTNEFVYID